MACAANSFVLLSIALFFKPLLKLQYAHHVFHANALFKFLIDLYAKKIRMSKGFQFLDIVGTNITTEKKRFFDTAFCELFPISLFATLKR